MQVKYEPWAIKKEDKEYWGVRILEGKFAEMTIAFNDISMSGEAEDSVTLDYDVIYSVIPTDQIEGPEFNETMSFIIQDILVKAMNEFENRKSNSAESNQ